MQNIDIQQLFFCTYNLSSVFDTNFAICVPTHLWQTSGVEGDKVVELIIEAFGTAQLHHVVAEFGSKVEIAFAIAIYLVEERR